LEVQPVCCWHATDKNELIQTSAENDHATHEATRRAYWHKMIGAVEVEIGKAVDPDIGEERFRRWTLDDQFVHVV